MKTNNECSCGHAIYDKSNYCGFCEGEFMVSVVFIDAPIFISILLLTLAALGIIETVTQ